MSVVLGKRLRSDPGVRPVRQRAELTGLLACDDPLVRLSRLFLQLPRDVLSRLLESSAGDFDTAVSRARALVESQEAGEVVERCASATSICEAVAIVEVGMKRYRARRAQAKTESTANTQVEGLLKDNAVLKKAVRFLHEKLQGMAPEMEENDRIRRELEKERQVKEALLFHLHTCN